jgi:hypothetical protein
VLINEAGAGVHLIVDDYPEILEIGLDGVAFFWSNRLEGTFLVE